MASELPMVATRVEVALYKRIRKAAAEDGRSVANYVARLLEAAHPVEGVVHSARSLRGVR